MANTYVITLLQLQGNTAIVTGTVNGVSVTTNLPASAITGAANAIAAETAVAAAMLAVAQLPFTSTNLPSATFTI
jgi:hypothetical protein